MKITLDLHPHTVAHFEAMREEHDGGQYPTLAAFVEYIVNQMARPSESGLEGDDEIPF